MKSCEEYQALIESYLDDELTREQKHLFETHISSCNDCREALKLAKSIRQALTALPEIDVPENFNTVLRQRINTECKAPKKTLGIYSRKYGALAACVVLAVVIGSGLSEMDFAKNSELYNDFVAEGTPVPTLVPEIAPEQNAGENYTPTKEKRTVTVTPSPKADTSAEKKIQTDAADLMPADKGIGVSAESTDTQPVEEASQENVPMTAALTDLYDAPSPTPETQEFSSSGGGGGSSARDMRTQAAPTVSLSIPSDYSEAALGLVKEFAVENDGIYTANKASFDKLLDAFDVGGIPYTINGLADGDVVIFTISI